MVMRVLHAWHGWGRPLQALSMNVLSEEKPRLWGLHSEIVTPRGGEGPEAAAGAPTSTRFKGPASTTARTHKPKQVLSRRRAQCCPGSMSGEVGWA